MTVKLLTRPNMHHDLKGLFRHLADRDRQMREIKELESKNYQCCYAYILSHIYDLYDRFFLDFPSPESIGMMFYDEEEAKMVWDFCKWFDDLTTRIECEDLTARIGEEQPDSAYLEHPEWPKVWEGAKKIYELMEANEKKYDIQASYDAEVLD